MPFSCGIARFVMKGYPLDNMSSSKYQLSYLVGGTDQLIICGFYILNLFLSLVFSFFLLDRAFQEFDNLTATLEHNRNYLSDSYSDFLFNNDEYLWTPVRTYYKKRLL